MIYTRYLRDKQGRLKGCVVKLADGKLGYSLCHPNDKNKMSKKMARRIAVSRALKCEISRDFATGPFIKRRGNHKAWRVPRIVERELACLEAVQSG